MVIYFFAFRGNDANSEAENSLIKFNMPCSVAFERSIFALAQYTLNFEWISSLMRMLFVFVMRQIYYSIILFSKFIFSPK